MKLFTERLEVEHLVDAGRVLDVHEELHTEHGVDEHDEEQQETDVEERRQRHSQREEQRPDDTATYRSPDDMAREKSSVRMPLADLTRRRTRPTRNTRMTLRSVGLMRNSMASSSPFFSRIIICAVTTRPVDDVSHQAISVQACSLLQYWAASPAHKNCAKTVEPIEMTFGAESRHV